MEGGRGMYKDCIVTVDVYFQAVMVFRFTTVPTVSIMDGKYIIIFLMKFHGTVVNGTCQSL